jgi:hypothetical protein
MSTMGPTGMNDFSEVWEHCWHHRQQTPPSSAEVQQFEYLEYATTLHLHL